MARKKSPKDKDQPELPLDGGPEQGPAEKSAAAPSVPAPLPPEPPKRRKGQKI